MYASEFKDLWKKIARIQVAWQLAKIKTNLSSNDALKPKCHDRITVLATFDIANI